MTLPYEYEEPWNEDDRLFAEGMEAILHQAYHSEGVDHTHEVLLARIAVELHAIRCILDQRLGGEEEPWSSIT